MIKLNHAMQIKFNQSQKQSEVIFSAYKSVNQLESALIKLIAVSKPIDIRTAAISSIKANSFLDEAIQNLQEQLNNNTVNNLAKNLIELKPQRMKIIKFGKKNKDDLAFLIIKQIEPQVNDIAKNLDLLIQKDKLKISNLLLQFETQTLQTLQTLGLIIIATIVLLFIINHFLRSAKLELKKLNQNLEMKVKKRTQQLEDSNHEIQHTIDKLKKTKNKLVESEKMASLVDLVTGVAHEINTPIGICISSATHWQDQTNYFSSLYSSGVLQKKDFEKYIVDANETATLLNSNLSKAANLISSFKEVAVDPKNELPTEFDLNFYIKGIILSLKPELNKTPHLIELICKEEVMVTSMQSTFSPMISHLISNSLTHAFDGIESGRITLELKKESKIIQIIYTDNGIGISKENIHKIFDPFYTTKRGSDCYGLGLCIIYNLITHTLNGTIKCSSELDRYTKFVIEFPQKLLS
ncbi:HAMP domain-containing sensor histidine kinase [Pseudoalteromonas sp. NBT06-2]|uniref:sensor histidine kinase n=1 Tax=Pseudoalteromonas sp. NBT06-2 TaxID=2025950 RepID=UPI0014829767|nr:HAMP domain-containing sensor histidine kinase [Pseudoalteromonas sp. NBT06-2]